MKKRTKQIMAVMAATTMTLSSSLAVSAANTASGDATVNGTGDMNYVDVSKVYEVTLPTANSLQFVIDPQGLTSLENGQSAKVDDLIANSTIVTKEGSGAYIKNESSVRMKVTAKMAITDTNTGKEVTPVDTLNAVTANSNTNICLLAIPSSVSSADLNGYTASTQGIVISALAKDNTTTDFSFVLDKASYSITKDASGNASYVKDDTENNFDAASFKLGGKANGKADWSAYSGSSKKDIGVKAVFSYAEAADTDVAKAGYSAHGLMDLGTVKEETVTAPSVAPSITATTATFSKANGVDIAVNLGSGAAKATGITSIATVVNGTPYAWDASGYSLEGSTLKIKPTASISSLAVGQSRTVRITFNDSVPTTKDLTFTVAN